MSYHQKRARAALHRIGWQESPEYAFGSRSGPILFGWVFFGHQVGAALAAYGGGLLRVWLGTYHVAFTTAGLLALGAAGLVLTIRQGQRPRSTAASRQTPPMSMPEGLAAPRTAPR